VGNIDRYPTNKGGKVTEVVVYANYIGLRRFYRYVVNKGRWSPYEGGQLDRFHCIYKMGCLEGSGVPVLYIRRKVPKG